MKNLLFLIAVILFAVLLFSGCAAIKSAKDAKAVGRVMSSTDLSNQVFARLVIEHPCPPAEVEYIPGKTDTIITIKENNDSLNNIIDSLLSKNCPVENLDSLRNEITKEIGKRCKADTVRLLRVDTVKVPDPRQLQIANDSLNFQRGQNAILISSVADYKKSNTQKMWWIIGISVFALLVIGGLCYLLFKK